MKYIINVIDIIIPHIISLNQCTPDINLPIITQSINIKVATFTISRYLLFIYLFDNIKDDVHTQIASTVCDDGNDASNLPSIIIGL